MKTRLGGKELFSLVLFFIWVTATCQGLCHIDLTPAVGVRHWEHRQISIWFHASRKEGSFFAPKNKAVDSFLDWRVGQGQDWRQREEFFLAEGLACGGLWARKELEEEHEELAEGSCGWREMRERKELREGWRPGRLGKCGVLHLYWVVTKSLDLILKAVQSCERILRRKVKWPDWGV